MTDEPSHPMPVLMGLRGSGKSTLGRALAQRLNRPFIDLDDVTPAVLGRSSVAQAWAEDGPAAFREAERKALEHVLATDAGVLALGGGTPTAAGAAAILKEHQRRRAITLIYLAATAEQLRERLRDGAGANRPSLTGGDPLAEIDRVLADRDPLYRSIADYVLDVGGQSEAASLDALLRIVEQGRTPR